MSRRRPYSPLNSNELSSCTTIRDGGFLSELGGLNIFAHLSRSPSDLRSSLSQLSGAVAFNRCTAACAIWSSIKP